MEKSNFFNSVFRASTPPKTAKIVGDEAQKEQLNGQPLLVSMDAYLCPQN
jgi:hypothetical protein